MTLGAVGVSLGPAKGQSRTRVQLGLDSIYQACAGCWQIYGAGDLSVFLTVIPLEPGRMPARQVNGQHRVHGPEACMIWKRLFKKKNSKLFKKLVQNKLFSMRKQQILRV